MKGSYKPIITVLLAPLSLIYGIVIFFRNLFFDIGIFSSREFALPVISVGNITVGGTGKTPHVEHIISILKDEFRVAVLSRGYKRKSTGFVVASTASTIQDIGDEPLQIKKKFPEVEVVVDGDRVRGIRKLCLYSREIQAVILDDAFQHRWVKPGISILLIDYNQPIKDDYLLPAGRLRESASAKKRAVIVVVTKCPSDIKPIERRIITKDLNLFPWQSLYFSTFRYCDPLPVFSGALPFPGMEQLREIKPSILMITGIANPQLLKIHLNLISNRIEQICFSDHHQFTSQDINRIKVAWQSIKDKRKIIITTEKDAMRFAVGNNIDPEIREKMYYIPIDIRFIENDGELFKNQILNYVRNNKREHIIY